MSEESEANQETAVPHTHPVAEHLEEHERLRAREAGERRSEVVKFILLALVLVVVIVGVALSRSLIFDRILPAIVRTDLSPVPASGEGIGGAGEEAVPPADDVSADESVEETESEVFIPTAVTGEEASDTPPVETEDTPPQAEEPTTAVPAETEPTPATAPVTHVVQRGENLLRIAEQYNVSVQDLLQANGLTNPDYIQAGQVLLIPSTP